MSLIAGAIAALETGARVLTVNTRLARTVRESWHRRRAAAGERAWDGPLVLPWGAWLDRCWRETISAAAAEVPARLAPAAEAVLWEEIVRGHTDMIAAESSARLAAEAWRLAHAWQIELDGVAFSSTADTQAFQTWAREFHSRMERRNWLEDARLADFVTRCIRGKTLPPPHHLTLAGFDEIPPQQQTLLDALAEAGCRIEHLAPPDRQAAAELVGFPDTEHEIAAAAQWTRGILERSGIARIAVVVPALAQLRDRVERVFLEVFHPEALATGRMPRPCAFHISRGIPLARQPLARAALLGLNLLAGRVALEDASAFLRSPYFTDVDAARLAQLDLALRKRGEPESPPKLILNLALTLAPALAARLSAILVAPKRLTPAQWAGTFSATLRMLGWPGERPLDSVEYQALERWKEALSSFASLGAVTGELGIEDALALLRRLSGSTLFQVEDEGSPVQILSVAETAGLDASHLWIMGLDDMNWPPPPRPNPFLPLTLQRARMLPDASPALALERAQRTTIRWLAAAPEIVVSYPAAAGEQELRRSPLLAGLSESALDSCTRGAYYRWMDVLPPGAADEIFEDSRATPLPDGAAPRGGASLLRAQAACPFQAFARYRLHTTDFPVATLGLNPLAHGNVLHEALHNCWQEIGDPARLRQLDERTIEGITRRATGRAVRNVRREHEGSWEDKVREIEVEVLAPLLASWLRLEQSRPGEFRIVGIEEKTGALIGGLQLRLRADRIDELDAAGSAIIDYKLKAQPVTAQAWESERPDEPQLPLYAVTMQPPPAAIAFGLFTRGEVKFEGLARTEGLLPGVKAADQWEEKLAEWHGVLERLAAAFRSGDARVDPKRGADTCANCGLTPLCRVHETSAIAAEENVE